MNTLSQLVNETNVVKEPSCILDTISKPYQISQFARRKQIRVTRFTNNNKKLFNKLKPNTIPSSPFFSTQNHITEHSDASSRKLSFFPHDVPFHLIFTSHPATHLPASILEFILETRIHTRLSEKKKGK